MECIDCANHVAIERMVCEMERIPRGSVHADLNFPKSLFELMWRDSMEQASRFRGFCVYPIVDSQQVWVP